MSTTTSPAKTLKELLQRVGDVPRERVVFDPTPGTATIADVQRLCDGNAKRKCELVDGVLVEKTMGHRESWMAIWLSIKLGNFVIERQLGVMTGEAGPYEIHADQIRFPDLAYTSWDRIPIDADPKVFAPDWTPNLVVEILSPSNTRQEMQRKLEDYFAAGVELVWYIDPDEQVVEVFTGVDQKQTLNISESLSGGAVLPGFEVSVKDIFEAGEFRRPQR